MLNKVLVAGLAVLVFSTVSRGQVWKEKYLQAQEAYSKETYDQAFAFADESLKNYISESGAVNENYAAILRLLSTISYVQQKLPEGLEFVKKELQVRADKKDTAYAVALANKGQFEEQLGEYKQAIQTLLECHAILIQYYKEDDIRVLECALSLATNYYFLNDYKKSKEWFDPSLAAIEKKQEYTEDVLEAFYYAGMLHLETGATKEAVETFTKTKQLYTSAELTKTLSYPMILYGLAHAYHRSQSHNKAEDSYREAQTIYENLAGKEGENYFTIVNGRAVNLHYIGKQSQAEELINELRSQPGGKASSAAALSTIASIYHARAEYAKAEALYKEALSNYDKTDKASLIAWAETNLNLAMLYAEIDNHTEALTRIGESSAIIEQQTGKEGRTYVKVLNKTGMVQMLTGNLVEAQTAFDESSRLLSKMQDKPEEESMTTTTGIGEVALRKGNYRKADSIYMSVIKPYETGIKPQDRFYSLAMNNLAASKQSQGRFSESLAFLKKSIACTGRLSGKSSLIYGIAIESMALICLRLGDLSTAKNHLDSALLIYEKTAGKESVEYANGMMSLGRYYQVTGDYTQAEPYLKNAREIIRNKKGDQSGDYAEILNSLALLYQTLGNYRDAEILLKESKFIIEKTRGKGNAEYSTAAQNLATLYQLEGNYPLAEPLLKEALEIDKKVMGENHPQYAITLQNLATLYQKLGKRAEAQEILERVLNVTAQNLGKTHPSYATTLSNLAVLYQDQGNFALAEATWKQSVELRKQVLGEDHPDYARSLYGLAGVYHAQGQLGKAREYYEPVVTKYQKQVHDFFPALSEKEKSAFYAKIKPVFDAYQDFCIQYLFTNPAESASSLEKLFDLQLSTKAILLNATNKVRARIQASGDKDLQESFKEWLATKEEIVRFFNASQEERTKLNLDLSILEAKANDLEKKLSTQSDAFRSHYDKDVVTWKDVRNVLQENEAAVEILRIKKKYVKDSIYYVGLILKKSSTSPEVVVWKQGAQLEGRKFKYHRNTIKFHINDTISHKFFWQPLKEKLQNGTTVYLSCDGVFNKVNFNSLYEAATHRFVIDDFRLRQVSNTRELVGRESVAKSSVNAASLFGFADFNLGATDVVSQNTKRGLARSFGFDGEDIPVLPATEKEIDEIEQLLKTNQWEATSFKKSNATEENIKKANNPKLIHIATHGFFLSDLDMEDNENSELNSNPLFRSGVLLAGAGASRDALLSQEDGVLTAYEAMNLNLDQTELVVLSACETGLGEVRNGEGVYGLQRSFLVAGANTVLMSLWQVDDVATQQLMNAFYSFWLKGAEKHEAFRNAQLSMKEKYQVPYFWGAFVLIGN